MINFIHVILKEDDQEESPSPTRLRIAKKSAVVDNNILRQIDQNKEQILSLKQKNSKLESQLIILESENQHLQDKLSRALSDLDALRHENRDFKDRANIGLLECLELDLKREREINNDLKFRIDDKQKEYRTKLQNYCDRFEEYRNRISELEEYRTRYEDLIAHPSNITKIQEIQPQRKFSGEIEEFKMEIKKLESKIKEEQVRNQSIVDDAINDKENSIRLDIKVNELEQENLRIDLENKELDLKVQDLQTQLDSLKVSFFLQN